MDDRKKSAIEVLRKRAKAYHAISQSSDKCESDIVKLYDDMACHLVDALSRDDLTFDTGRAIAAFDSLATSLLQMRVAIALPRVVAESHES